jgi:hypothetical protein
MKKILIIIVLAVAAMPLFSQNNIESSLNEARQAYKDGKLEAARYALQQALNEVDLAMAQEILKMLPQKMGNMSFSDEDETVGSASIGFAGLFVSRTYRQGEDQSANLQIIADSPMLAGINAILSLPMIGNDPNMKRIRIAGYRGLLNKNTDQDGNTSWDLQIPFGSSLMTINFQGINDEKQVMSMAESVQIDKIAKFIQ